MLFMHHQNCCLTRYHFESLQNSNPDVCCVPICFGAKSSLPGSIDLSKTEDPELDWFFEQTDKRMNRGIEFTSNPEIFSLWKNLDICLLKWFRHHRIPAKRVIFLEWDCLVNDSIEKIYSDVWDRPLVCSMHKTQSKTPNWAWFKLTPIHRILELKQSAQAVVPLAGMLFSEQTLATLLQTILSTRGRYENLISELRLGAAASDSNIDICQLPTRKNRQIRARQLCISYPKTSGMYHPIKDKPGPWFFSKALLSRTKYELQNDCRLAMQNLRSKVSFYLMALAGYLRFKFGRTRTIVAIVSPARSGSTLLKALLGTATDVSHLPEWPNERVVSTEQSTSWLESFAFYWRATSLSDCPIVVLKKPAWVYSQWPYPQLPDRYIPIRLIVLSRDREACRRSFREMESETEHDYADVCFDEYYDQCYRSISDYIERSGNEHRLVSYESLVADSINTTASLFRWIGSSSSQGVAQYQDYQGSWFWEFDDASKKIFSLAVQAPEADAIGLDSAKTVEHYLPKRIAKT